MTTVKVFEHDRIYGHYNREKFQGYIYDEVFPLRLFNSIKNTVTSIIDNGETNTFLTHNTEFVIEDQRRKLISHKDNGREQIVLYDLFLNRQWYYQTIDTIKVWSDQTLHDTISPIFYKAYKTIENLEPFKDNKQDWIFSRMHINYLEPGKLLSLHYDANQGMLDVDHYSGVQNADIWSITCYLYDHVEGEGGELWTPCGFVYKPKANTAACINGNKILHGVTQNISDKPRLAFTMRAVHKDYLYLPGHPDKFLYNILQTL